LTNLLQGVETLVFDLPVDSLQEFNLTVSNYAAEYGQSGGGIISMTTKSGTNRFHGSAYTYYRTKKIAAVPNFAAPNPLTGKLTTSPLNYKKFGGSIGGPVLSDKTHFFFTREGKYVTSSSLLRLCVPSVAETQGDFSGAIASLIAANPVKNADLQLTDPNSGLQAVGDDGTLNKLPTAELDPYGKILAAYYPAPNLTGAALNTNNYAANDPAKLVDNTYVARIDHSLGTRDTLYARFLGEPQHTDTADVFPTAGTDNYGSLSHAYYYSEAGTYTRTFTPKLINEVRLAFTQRQGLSIAHGIGSAAEKSLALPGINPNYFPGVNVQGLASIGNVNQQERLQTPILSNEFTDNLSWQRGHHQFKFGLSYRTSADGDKYYPYDGRLFGFIGSGNVSGNTAVAGLANLLLGRVDNAQRIETEYLHSLAWTWGGYVQDNWKVNSKLSLNLGLRYDLESPRYLDNNHQNSFDATAINPVSGTPGVVTFSGINGQSKYANNFDDKLFGPRFGFAYAPREGWGVRGGGAILYPGEYDAATPVTAFTGCSNSISLASTNSKAGVPAFLLADNLAQGVERVS
jgi:outer membrane receptor protein involved in Fe transport